MTGQRKLFLVMLVGALLFSWGCSQQAKSPASSSSSASEAIKPFLGRWDLTIKTPAEERPSWIEISEDQGQAKGLMTGFWGHATPTGEIQVKEFDLEQTADAWIFLDLEHGIQTGVGDESTTESAIRVVASIADKAIVENRAVGLTVNAHRMAVLPADRGSRQHLKIMQLLAAVDADGTAPLAETPVQGLGPGRPRRTGATGPRRTPLGARPAAGAG